MFKETQKNVNFKKVFKIKIKGLKYTKLQLGVVGLRALQSSRLLPKQMETLRLIFTRGTKKSGKIWLSTKINYLLSKKSKGSRMGKGVGKPTTWVIEVKVGQIIIEFSNVIGVNIIEILIQMANKMPVKVDFIFKQFRY